MISACENSVKDAYDHIGRGEDDRAIRIVNELGRCGIRQACPFATPCAAKVAEMRVDLSSLISA